MSKETDLLDKKITDKIKSAMPEKETLPSVGLSIRSIIHNVKENWQAIAFTWVAIGVVFSVGYTMAGEKIVQDSAKAVVKPILDSLTVAVRNNTKVIKNLSENQSETANKIDFINDVLYNMDPSAYNKTKKEREEKALRWTR